MRFFDRMLRWEVEDQFDRLSSARVLGGLVKTLNKYIGEHASTAFMRFDKERLSIALNCGDEEVEWMMQPEN